MAALFQDLANQSSFVFEGVVRQVGAVTTSGLQAAPDMAVVQITKVLKGPSVLSNFSGKGITVQLPRPFARACRRCFLPIDCTSAKALRSAK
jgi:hypothetical protein